MRQEAGGREKRNVGERDEEHARELGLQFDGLVYWPGRSGILLALAAFRVCPCAFQDVRARFHSQSGVAEVFDCQKET